MGEGVKSAKPALVPAGGRIKVKAPQKRALVDAGLPATQPCPCAAPTVTLRCGHSQRKLTVPASWQTGNSVVLEVIGASTTGGEWITLDYARTCKHGQPGCPTVWLTDYWTLADAMLARKQPSIPDPHRSEIVLPKPEGPLDLAYFTRYALHPNAHPSEYVLVAGTCSGFSVLGQVHAFPKVEWNGSLTLGFSHKAHKDSNFNKGQGYKKLKARGQWGVTGSITGTCGDMKLALDGPELTAKGSYKDSLFRGAQRILNQLTPLLGDLKSDYGSIEIVWPKLTLSGTICNGEEVRGARVAAAGQIAVSFEPLIGAKFTVDILNWILKVFGDSVGGVGSLLVKAKKLAADKGLTIAINLSLEGTIGGGLTWTRRAGGTTWITSGMVDFAIELEIEGIASIEIDVFVVKVGGGARISATSQIGAKLAAETGEGGPMARGQLYFTGVTIEYAYWVEIGGADTRPGGVKPKLPSGDPAKVEATDSLVLVDPAHWPSDGELIALADL